MISLGDILPPTRQIIPPPNSTPDWGISVSTLESVEIGSLSKPHKCPVRSLNA